MPVSTPASAPAQSGAARRGVLLLFLCATLWSLNGPLIKDLQLRHQTGLSIAIWRSAFAGLALLLPAARNLRALPRTPWWLIAGASFAAMCALFVSATTRTQAANAIILQYTAPCWIFLLSPALLGEYPPRHDWTVLVIAMFGIGVIFAGQFTSAGLGLILGLASGLAFAMVVVSMRRLRHGDPLATACVLNLASALILAPLPLLAASDKPNDLFAAPLPVAATTWLLLAAMGVLQMAVPYWLFARALRNVPAATASLVTLCEPLLNTTWTYLWIGERPLPTTLVGGALILGGLVLKNRLDRRASAPLPAKAT